MNAHTFTPEIAAVDPTDPVNSAWGRATRTINQISNGVSYLHVDLCRLGALFPYATFPEQHALDAAKELDKLAADLRDMVTRAAKARTELAA